MKYTFDVFTIDLQEITSFPPILMNETARKRKRLNEPLLMMNKGNIDYTAGKSNVSDNRYYKINKEKRWTFVIVYKRTKCKIKIIDLQNPVCYNRYKQFTQLKC